MPTRCCARPQTVVVTTPNREYNVKFLSLPAGRLRHKDHRFEWTRQEFQEWASRVAQTYGYRVRVQAIGEDSITLSTFRSSVASSRLLASTSDRSTTRSILTANRKNDATVPAGSAVFGLTR